MVHRVTLRDIAQAVGVSITTVSLVLNGRSARVSEQTKRLIIETAEKMQYIPNQNARSLVTNSTMLIALIVPDIENMYFASLARQIEEACQAQGYSLIIANSDDSRENEHNLLQKLSSRDVDGIFLIPSGASYGRENEVYEDLKTIPCPVTLIDRMVSAGKCDGAGFDNKIGGKLAAQYLLNAGHTRIGCITGGGTSVSSNRRWVGFSEALEEAGVQLDPQLQLVGDYRVESGYQLAEQLLKQYATAVFCCNDLMALGALRKLESLGLRCPEDLSIIGYDNILPRFGLPTEVTTIEQDITALAHHSWKLLFKRIQEEKTIESPWLENPVSVILEPKLIDNGTVSTITMPR